MLHRQREAAQEEITAAIAGHCAESALARLLENETDLVQQYEAATGRLASVRERLKQLYEQRGRTAEQVDALAADRRLAEAQLELSAVDQQLAEALGRWRVLALAWYLLDTIREEYETERQPETLKDASLYLAQLTAGRYVRVWTPLGEDVLRVDQPDGTWLPVEALSRGTREQLFLSLRLAMARSYARRGAVLPLVLDDVLVNFDVQRVKAAARVLREFAAAGHQVLVFTCHEHIQKIFKSVDVDIRRLPDARAADEPAAADGVPQAEAA